MRLLARLYFKLRGWRLEMDPSCAECKAQISCCRDHGAICTGCGKEFGTFDEFNKSRRHVEGLALDAWWRGEFVPEAA